MCLYAYVNAIEFFLVSWPEEATVSVVPSSRLFGGAVVVDTCILKVGCHTQGKILSYCHIWLE